MSDSHANCGFKAECLECDEVLEVGTDRESVFRAAYEHKQENPKDTVFVTEGWLIK